MTLRTHLDASRAALRRMREHAQDLYQTGEDVAGDPFAAETLGRTLTRRIAELADDPSTPLFFGRLDFADSVRYHIGRRHVTDDAGEPMVLDELVRAELADSIRRSGRGRYGEDEPGFWHTFSVRAAMSRDRVPTRPVVSWFRDRQAATPPARRTPAG